jgi:predicted nuclease with TOPRIM domain
MQVRVLKIGMAALLLVTLAACKKEEPPKVEAIDPNQELRQTNADIAKRLAEQKAEVEKKNDAARGVADSERAVQEKRQSAEAAITVVGDMKSKWETLLAEANKTPNTEIADLLKRMDGVKTEVQSHKGDECTEGARITLLAGVSQGYDAYREFSTATAVTPALQKKVDDSRTLLARADAELQACRSR